MKDTEKKEKKIWLVIQYEDNVSYYHSKEEAIKAVQILFDEGVPIGDIEVYEAVEREIKPTFTLE